MRRNHVEYKTSGRMKFWRCVQGGEIFLINDEPYIASDEDFAVSLVDGDVYDMLKGGDIVHMIDNMIVRFE